MKALALLLVLTSTLGAGQRSRKLYIASVVAVAGAAVADGMTSRGRYELNPVLGRGVFGPRQAGIKISLTAPAMLMQAMFVRRTPAAAKPMVFINAGVAGVLAATAARNSVLPIYR